VISKGFPESGGKMANEAGKLGGRVSALMGKTKKKEQDVIQQKGDW